TTVTSGAHQDERAELVRLRRENRVQAMEIEILKRASAYFARENVLPNRVRFGPRAGRAGLPCRGDLPSLKGLHLPLLRMAASPPVAPRP
ncbi:MAG TPA: hypothetical protein VFB83_03510, partial [Propionibacteriaceae bacterium]|nr:hypothetical protein [Propionibacteriaceae bacterium]